MLTHALGRYAPLLRLILRVAAVLFASAAGMAVIGLLLIRVWVWPALPQWKEGLLSSAQRALAQHELVLDTGTFSADWEHWYRPRVRLERVVVTRADGQRVGSVERIEATLGWRSLASLWHWQPVFSEIRLANPVVMAERTALGEVRIAGVPVGASSGDPSALNWLLRQGRFRLDGGQFEWRDGVRERRAQLVDITLAMTNFGHSHAWALKATPPSSLGEGFVLQGEFQHSWWGAPSAIHEWKGEAFVQFDRVNLSELFGFVHLPAQAPLKVNSGQGAMRAWVQVRANALEDLTVDLDLTDASLQWGVARRPLTLQQLQGRVQTRITPQAQAITLTGLTLKSSQLTEPATIASAQMRLEQSGPSDAQRAEISAKQIDLLAAMWLTEHLPLPVAWKSTLTDLQPRGKLTNLKMNWQESATALTQFRLESEFAQLALAAGKTRPGFHGLSGKLMVSEEGGELALATTGAGLTFPGVWAQDTIAADRLDAKVTWTSAHLLAADARASPSEIVATVRQLAISNADVAVEATGTVRWPGSGAGVAALEGRVVRADPTRIHRYVPTVVSADTRTWLRDSLLASKPYHATFELHGPLDRFPFRDDPSSRFVVKAHAPEASLRPAPGWPVISNIRADVEFNKQSFRIAAKGARLNDMTFSDIDGRIDDMEAARPILVLDGTLSGDVQKLIDATNRSPLRRTLQDATSDMKAKGQASLALSMKLDLDNTDRSLVQGRFSLTRGLFRFSESMPEVSVASADIGFDQDGLRSVDLQGQALGGPMRVTHKPAAKGMSVSIEGQATADGLEKWAEQALGFSLDDVLSGSTRYAVTVDSRAGVTQARLATSLNGLGSDFFGPFKKRSHDDWGLRVDVTHTASKPGSVGSQSWVISSNQQKINAKINRNLGVSNETVIELDSRAMAGQFKWLPARTVTATKAVPGKSGRATAAVVQARLTRLWLDKREHGEETASDGPSDRIAQDWPTVDLVVEDFRVGERVWGRLEVQASPVAATRSWEILRVAISNPDAELTGQGQWAMIGTARGPRRSRTTLDVALSIKNGGALLTRSGYPKVVRDTNGKIEGRLNWPGSPLDFAGTVLNGNLSLNLQQGQFLKAEPGLARLVGVLNLQSLPRRIKLDFRDVFSEGFTYERIRGDLQFTNGAASTQNLRIIGVQASVLLEGAADIRSETQDLRVLVLPEINAGLASLGYAALVNPAVGLGAFVAQYILRNPVRELLSYEYRVTGGWDDPKVESVKREIRTDSPEMKSSEK